MLDLLCLKEGIIQFAKNRDSESERSGNEIKRLEPQSKALKRVFNSQCLLNHNHCFFIEAEDDDYENAQCTNGRSLKLFGKMDRCFGFVDQLQCHGLVHGLVIMKTQ